ncbi:MAG: glycosyltransferase, partial [Gammaproteobacteria bacterium]
MTGEPSVLQTDQSIGADIDPLSRYDIAVIVPCYNEETAIEAVVKDFHAALPSAQIYVYDNASSDNTADVATAAGVIVRYEARPGKGNVVRRMFADIEADIYIMVDGDDTYEAAAA